MLYVDYMSIKLKKLQLMKKGAQLFTCSFLTNYLSYSYVNAGLKGRRGKKKVNIRESRVNLSMQF